MKPTSCRGAAAITIALAVGALSACESDGDTMSDAACDAYADAQAAFFGDPSELGASFAALAEAVPGALADDATVVAEAAGSDDPAAFESPAVAEAAAAIGDAVFDDCDTVAAVDVDGVDYAFDGLPAEVDAGRVAFRIENESATGQPHELILVTGADGQSADQLRDLPMEELMMQARPVAVAFASTPDSSATTLVDLAPGSYLVICTLPVAEGGAPADPAAPPTDTHADTHADHGMVATLTVV